eukprot:1883649-Pyramimonas_sp.AAC.1
MGRLWGLAGKGRLEGTARIEEVAVGGRSGRGMQASRPDGRNAVVEAVSVEAHPCGQTWCGQKLLLTPQSVFMIACAGRLAAIILSALRWGRMIILPCSVVAMGRVGAA